MTSQARRAEIAVECRKAAAKIVIDNFSPGPMTPQQYQLINDIAAELSRLTAQVEGMRAAAGLVFAAQRGEVDMPSAIRALALAARPGVAREKE